MNEKNREPIVRILGLGLDGEDGHIRITRGKNFDVLFGSERTHDRMQEACIKINQELDARGKRLEEVSKEEFIDLLGDIES